MSENNFRVKNGLEVGIGGTIINTLSTGNVGVGTTNPLYKLTVKAGTADTTNWVVTYGDTGIGVTEQYVSTVAYDSQGNIYASGSDYDNGIPFVVKFDTYGSIIWQKFFEHADPNRDFNLCEGVAVDKSDDSVYVSIKTQDSIQSSTLVKLNSSGSILWQREIETAPNPDNVYAIGIGTTGDVYITGYTSNQGAGNNDGFIIKFNSSGTEQWQRVIGGTSSDYGYGVAVDSSNNVYVVGETESQGAGSYDGFIIKFNSSGTEQWQRTIGGTADDVAVGVAIDSSNNVYVTGRTNSQGAGNGDALIIKFNSSGTEQWQRVIGGINFDYGYGVAIDSSNNVYITGQSDNIAGTGIFIASFDSSGNIRTQKQLYSGNYESQWYNEGHDYIDIRNDKLIIGGYTYNTAPNYYADGFVAQLPTSLDTSEHFGNNYDFTFRDSNFTVGISTLTVGVSTLTVGVSTIGVTTAGLTTATSPPVYSAALYTPASVSIDATGESNFVGLNANDIFVEDLRINDLPLTNTSGVLNNFIVGFYAGVNNTTGSNNNFLGQSAGNKNTTGSYNNFLGYAAGYGNTSGTNNNFLGFNAGFANTTGSNNNFIGLSAGFSNTTGSNNTFIGNEAGRNVSTGSYNVSLGHRAGYYDFQSPGSYNVYLGGFSGLISSGSPSRKIIIGMGTDSQYFDSPDTTKDTQFAVGIRTSSAASQYWLVGNENFNIGIGTTNPTEKLDVGGTLRLRNELKDFYGNVGAAGSVLVSTGAGVSWSSAAGSGAQGAQGTQGSIGIQGTIGIQGAQGTQGSIGIQGTIGIQGNVGSQGSQGVQGLSNQGVQGIQGTQGTFGPATIPQSADTSGSGDTILATDNGKLVVITGGLTIANVFAVGENVVIYNDSASQQTITQDAGVTLRLAGTSLTGNRFIQQRGVATVLCVKTGEYAISGAGVT